ncbi:uncharacterized protein LOC144333653 [Macaca mulatta]
MVYIRIIWDLKTNITLKPTFPAQVPKPWTPPPQDLRHRRPFPATAFQWFGPRAGPKAGQGVVSGEFPGTEDLRERTPPRSLVLRKGPATKDPPVNRRGCGWVAAAGLAGPRAGHQEARTPAPSANQDPPARAAAQSPLGLKQSSAALAPPARTRCGTRGGGGGRSARRCVRETVGANIRAFRARGRAPFQPQPDDSGAVGPGPRVEQDGRGLAGLGRAERCLLRPATSLPGRAVPAHNAPAREARGPGSGVEAAGARPSGWEEGPGVGAVGESGCGR